MNTALEFDISPVSLNIKNAEENKTPGNVGNSLFQNLLSKIDGSSGGEALGAFLYQGKKSLINNSGENSVIGAKSGRAQKLNKKLCNIFLNSSQLVLPDSALPKLISFLESQGFSVEKIDQLLLSSKDKDGLIRLDKLLTQLAKSEPEKFMDKQGHLIQAAHIPQTEELLFKMGLGTGEIKKVIEKSVNQKGEISIAELSDALKKHFSNPASEHELLSLLEHNDIKIKTPILNEKNMDPDLKKQFMILLENPSQDIQKTIKQNIAALLREKGIPPQEVKSFLENINVEISKSALKGETIRKSGVNIPLNQVYMKNQTAWQEGTWNEKILGILRNERLLISNDAGKGLLPDQGGEIKLNLAELLKQGDQKDKTELLFNIPGAKISPKPVKAETSMDNSIRSFQTLNSLGNDLILNNTGKELKGATSVSLARDVYNLPQPLPKILDRMIWMIRSGEQNGRILINPPELGRLDLDLTLKNGHLFANLSAETSIVKGIIEANLSQLKQQLTDQGLTVDKFEVMVGLDDKGSRKEDMWAGRGRKGSSSKKGFGTTKEGDQRIDEKVSAKSLINKYQIDLQV